MISPIFGPALILLMTLVFAVVIFTFLRKKGPLAPNLITRVYGVAMTLHATFNLVDVGAKAGSLDWPQWMILCGSALIFVSVYFFALWRNDEKALQAAISLALGSYAAFLILTAAGQFPFSLRLFAYISAVSAISLVVAWFARDRKPVPQSLDRSRPIA